MPALPKLKMPAPKSKEKDPMLEMDMEEIDESAPEKEMDMDMEDSSPEAAPNKALVAASDDELKQELEARGFSVQAADEGAEEAAEEPEAEIDFSK